MVHRILAYGRKSLMLGSRPPHASRTPSQVVVCEVVQCTTCSNCALTVADGAAATVDYSYLRESSGVKLWWGCTVSPDLS